MVSLLAGLVFLISCKPAEAPFVPGSGSGGDGGDKPVPPTEEPDWSLLTSANHPRIIFSAEDFDNLKSSIAGNEILTKLSDKVINAANAVVGSEDIEKKLEGKRMLSVSREAARRIIFCAYAYRMTGDEKYLNQAEHDIQTVCKFDNWNARQHFLDVGEMAAGVALGYDWLYKELKQETKTAVKKALNDYAFKPAKEGVWNLNFYEAENNWNQVCNGGLVCAALAVYEDNQSVSEEIIMKAIESNRPAMESMYSPDGNYPEGYSYWNYGTMFEALMLTALETAAGTDCGLSDVKGFSQTGKYMIFMEGTTRQCFNYSDCAPSTLECLPQWYFAYKFKDLSVLYLEKDRLDVYGNSRDIRMLPLIIYYAFASNISSVKDIPAPQDNIFKGEGPTPVVLIHENWKMDATDKFLGIKGGKAKTSHAHMDAGSFVYDAFGVRWSADLGLQSYSTLEPYIDLWDLNDGSERWTAFRYNNFNHSTITVNNAYHKAGGEAVITGLINNDGKKGATVDLTGPLQNEVASARRTIYMQGDALYVTDEITAKSNKAAKIRWTMVSKAEPTIEYGGITLESAGGKYMVLSVTSKTGDKPKLMTWSTKSTNSWDASNAGYYECGYELTVSPGQSTSVTVTLKPE